MLKYWLWLAELPGLGNQTRLALLNHFGSPKEIFDASEEALRQVEGLTRDQQRAVTDQRSFDSANRILEDCQRLGFRVLTLQDSDYPDRLRNIFDPPLVLYIRGRLPIFDEEAAVTVVGTRSCTPYGIDCANRLSYGVTACGGLVVTGLAKGIDSAAARGALRAGGRAVGVLGNGLDVVYPYENRFLYEDVAAAGVLISEYPPGTEPAGRHFPVRNRIMAGLSVGSLIVEAPMRSGALITARLALEQGRDVFAVPGPINSPASVGCIRLIQEGAYPVVDAWDLMEQYENLFPGKVRPSGPLPEQPFRSTRPRAPKPQEAAEAEPKPAPEAASPTPPALPVLKADGLSDDQITILEALDPERPAFTDDLVQSTGIPAKRVLTALTMLEVNQAVRQHSGKRYTRTVVLEARQD